MDLSSFQVLQAPPTIYYIPNFITPEEEAHILKNVYSVPKPKWTCLSKRRLQDYGGVPHEKGMIPEAIPNWLTKYMEKVAQLNVFEGNKPNQVLINEYLPGQGIMPHTDGPLFYPTIATISCGSHTVLEFLENNENRVKVCQLLLERCSLVIIKDDMFTKYLHSIRELDTDIIDEGCANLLNCEKQYAIGDKVKRDTRVSVTIRNVTKVLKVKLFK
ncbi:alpha-ketoglutarate-dependent dioxygenase alkB homolog 6 [Tribolium madens]|uniref:alpha-ketoglutarate-dependent dioxygenase alkB homolog 6 n=1 Tax=Tribolium madens TaxID=41895 RepID=UPI001CF75BEF|nr:alpha-ketoglutarate-dependent dioxygenase alkB homolog 6 [Tribolium madens]